MIIKMIITDIITVILKDDKNKLSLSSHDLLLLYPWPTTNKRIVEAWIIKIQINKYAES